jgi:hypothetical protein
MTKLKNLAYTVALAFLLSASSLLAQTPKGTLPQGTTATPTKAPGVWRAHQQPCWQQAGISQSAIQQRKQVEESTRSQVQAVCSDSSLSPQQKREKIRQLHEQAHHQIEGLISPSQQEALKACQQERSGVHGGHGGVHAGGGVGPCGEPVPGKGTARSTNPEPEPEPEQK